MDFIFAIVILIIGLIVSAKFYANQEQQQLAQGKVKPNKVRKNKVVSLKDKLEQQRDLVDQGCNSTKKGK